MIKKADYAKLEMHTTKIMDEYLTTAPGTMGSTFPEPKRRKYHRKADQTLTMDVPPDQNGVDQTKLDFFAKRIPSTDPLHVRRDPFFKGSFRGARANTIDPDDVYQFQYKDVNMMTDRWAVYNNAKYPWIIGGGRYLHEVHMPTRPDFTLLQIPAALGPGDYIIQYLWSGYYDGIDVTVLNVPSDIAAPYGAEVVLVPGAPPPPPDKFGRIHHCNFPANTRKGKCVGMKADATTGLMPYPLACIQECLGQKFEECNGVLVLPITNPSTVYKGFSDWSNVPWGTANCAKPTDGSTHVCYPLLARMGTELDFPYWATTDPEDPAFYGTCFNRIKYNGLPPIPQPTEPIDYEYRGKCITCADRDKHSAHCYTPVWTLSDTCQNCNSKDVKFTPPKEGVCDTVAPPAGVVTPKFGVEWKAANDVLVGLQAADITVTGATYEVVGQRAGITFTGANGETSRAQVKLDTTQFGKAFSFSTWVRFANLDGTTRNIVTQSDPAASPSNTNTMLGMRVMRPTNTTNNRVEFNIRVAGTSVTNIQSRNNAVNFQWYHIVLTYDGAVLSLYQNGATPRTMNVAGSVVGHATWPIKFGVGGSATTNRNTPCSMRKTAFFDKALTAAEVTALFSAQNNNN